MSDTLAIAETRQRLLEAALEVFAELGYRNATFREICRRAQANNAAVNYHFRDKENLYLEVLERELHTVTDSGLLDAIARLEAPPEARLRAFIRQLLKGLLGETRPTRLLKLMSNEMIEPTPGIELMVRLGCHPLYDLLRSIIADLMGADADPRTVERCMQSVMAQCMGYHHGRPLLARIYGYDEYDDALIEEITEHIARFSLGGIAAATSAPLHAECRSPAGSDK